MNQPNEQLETFFISYPFLRAHEIVHLERYAPAVPNFSNKYYDIVKMRGEDQKFALVTTDYPSPKRDSIELYALSKIYRFDDLIRPGKEMIKLAVREDNEMNDDFFVKDGNMYFYVSQISE